MGVIVTALFLAFSVPSITVTSMLVEGQGQPWGWIFCALCASFSLSEKQTSKQKSQPQEQQKKNNFHHKLPAVSHLRHVCRGTL